MAEGTPQKIRMDTSKIAPPQPPRHCPQMNVTRPSDDNSTFVQGMAWWLWLISMLPYGVTRPQRVETNSNSFMINIFIGLETFLSARCDKDHANMSIFLTWLLHRRWQIPCIFSNDSIWICKATSLKLCSVGFFSLTISTPVITVFIKTRDTRYFCGMRYTLHNQQYKYTFLPPRKTGIHISGRCLWD